MNTQARPTLAPGRVPPFARSSAVDRSGYRKFSSAFAVSLREEPAAIVCRERAYCTMRPGVFVRTATRRGAVAEVLADTYYVPWADEGVPDE